MDPKQKTSVLSIHYFVNSCICSLFNWFNCVHAYGDEFDLEKPCLFTEQFMSKLRATVFSKLPSKLKIKYSGSK